MSLDFYTSFSKNYGDQYKTWLSFANEIFAIQAQEETSPNDAETICNKANLVDNKNLHKINDITKIARNNSGNFCLTNCDIELVGDHFIWDEILKKEGLIIGQRYNYKKKYEHIGQNFGGIDFFIFNRQFEIEESNFAMGSCCWDWWIVYLAMIQSVPIYKINIPFVYHEIHDRRWSDDQWMNQMKIFESMYGIKQDREFKIKLLNYAIDIF